MPRGAHFTAEHQRAAARQRVAQPSFLEHNRRIAGDGGCACSAQMRGPSGSRLLHPMDVQFLYLSDLHPSRDRSQRMSEPDRRLLYGRYVWDAIWEGLNAPPKPEADVFLQRSTALQPLLRGKTLLPEALDMIYIAPDDFCQSDGNPLRKEKQRAAFREALREGRHAAEAWSKRVADERSSNQGRFPRQVGRRLPMQNTAPVFSASKKK